MTLNQAAQIYYSKTQMAQRTIWRMQLWDERKTIKQNAQALEIQFSWARRFAKQYGLKYERGA